MRSTDRLGLALMPVLPLMLLCLAQPAQAQFFKDRELEAASAANRNDELARLARERSTRLPNDPQTVLAQAVVALDGDKPQERKAALARAESCLQAQPQAAECHYAFGALLGVQAMSEGMLKAARSIGTIRDALAQASTLEPAWFPARSALVLFYLEVPGMLGGGTSKAVDVAAAAPRPEQVKALQARIALKDGKADAAMAAAVTLMPLMAATDSAVADDARQWVEQAGHQLLGEGEPAKALPVFERLARERPTSAGGSYGIGRVRAEQGANEEALKSYDQALTLQGAEIYPIEYRRGLALQKLGRNDAAKQAYQRFVSAGKGRKSSLDDAKKRLAELSS